MEDRRSEKLRDTLAQKDDFLRVVLVGAIIALGINLIAAGLFALIPATYPITLSLGLTIAALGLLYLTKLVMNKRHIRSTFTAFLIYDPEENEIVPIKEYAFAYDVEKTLNAAFLENNALKTIWEKERLRQRTTSKDEQAESTLPSDNEAAQVDNNNELGSPKPAYITLTRGEAGENLAEPRSAIILNEAIEFVVLERLSTHLADYFDDYPDDDKYKKEYKREDVPSLLLQNRILSLLTAPLENRAVFVEQTFSKEPPKGEIVSMMGSDGSLYQRFDLVLPNHTQISRPAPGILHFESERISMTLKASYQGFSLYIPWDFIGFYVGKNPEKMRELLVNISVDATIRRWGLFRNRGWNYYRWIDSFAESLERFASKDVFFERINWDALSAQLFVSNRRAKAKRRGLSNKPSPEKAAPTDNELNNHVQE